MAHEEFTEEAAAAKLIGLGYKLIPPDPELMVGDFLTHVTSGRTLRIIEIKSFGQLLVRWVPDVRNMV